MAIKALLFTLFAGVVWPSYIVLKIGQLPGLTVDRLFFTILIGLFFMHALSNLESLKEIGKYRKSIYLLIIYMVWLVISALAGSADKGVSFFAIANWFVYGPLLFFYILVFVKTPASVHKIIVTFFTALVLCNVIGAVEAVVQKPLFADYLISETENTDKALTIKIRDEIYRIKSVFTNPLVYAQLLLVSVVISIYIKNHFQTSSVRLLARINLIVSYVLMYYTGSRAGLALALAYPLIGLYVNLLKKRTTRSIYTIVAIHYLLIPVAVVLIGYYIFLNINEADNLRNLFMSGSVDQETISSLARILQLKLGFFAIMQEPVFGYGMGQALVNMEPLSSIDNYYLTMLLSTGFIGLFILLLFIRNIIATGKNSLRLYQDAQTGMFITAIIMMLAFYLILSISKANLFFYSFAALVLIRQQQLKKSQYYAKP